MRHDRRRVKELREIKMQRNVNPYAEGSCQIEMGLTKVLVTATVEQNIPSWLQGSGKGWITAEYSMLPRANRQRSGRDRQRSAGRSQEIQRLVGRALRAVVDLSKIRDIQIVLDCDVLLADGGTRCASIVAAYVALVDAVAWCRRKGLIKSDPFTDSVAAVSAGVVGGKAILDLDYKEDSAAEVDANFVVTGRGRLVEVQMTGEEATFDEKDLTRLLGLAKSGARRIKAVQQAVLAVAKTGSSPDA